MGGERDRGKKGRERGREGGKDGMKGSEDREVSTTVPRMPWALSPTQIVTTR